MQDREQQFQELFRAEYGRMYRAAYLLLGNADEAKDAVQDVFARLWESDVPLREESRRTFLLTCVRNRCLNLMARPAGAVPDVLTEPPVLSAADDDELLRLIHDYIDRRLTPQTSRILRMHYDDELTYKDIARQLGISLAAVNKHIVQGLRKLRQQFKSREE